MILVEFKFEIFNLEIYHSSTTKVNPKIQKILDIIFMTFMQYTNKYLLKRWPEQIKWGIFSVV